jgi:hypothetical protein
MRRCRVYSEAMQEWLKELLIKVIQDERIQVWVKNLITVASASAAKAAVDKLVETIPGIEGVVDAVEVAVDVRNDLDRLIPDFDTGIKPLDDLMDFWRP